MAIGQIRPDSVSLRTHHRHIAGGAVPIHNSKRQRPKRLIETSILESGKVLEHVAEKRRTNHANNPWETKSGENARVGNRFEGKLR
jgi:hypothetical protein